MTRLRCSGLPDGRSNAPEGGDRYEFAFKSVSLGESPLCNGLLILLRDDRTDRLIWSSAEPGLKFIADSVLIAVFHRFLGSFRHSHESGNPEPGLRIGVRGDGINPANKPTTTAIPLNTDKDRQGADRY